MARRCADNQAYHPGHFAIFSWATNDFDTLQILALMLIKESLERAVVKIKDEQDCHDLHVRVDVEGT